MEEKVDILAIGAHPDDVELSASGTIAKHIALGKKVAIIDMTEGELGSRGSVETRYKEAKKAQDILGVSYRANLQLQDGFFEESPENLMKLIIQIRRFRPEVVLANAPSDRHPDHGRGAAFVKRACFLSGLLKIETAYEGKKQEKWRPKSLYHYIQDNYLEPDFVIDVTPYKEVKFKSILAYETQFYNPNDNENSPKTPISGKDFLDYLEARMIQYGRCIGVQYAEGFIASRTVGVNSFFDII